ncbi:MAG: homocitrate synthase [Xanthomonadales bacterium]|nr:homocitrate synthase [Xanthomonadales bacterium]
MTDFESKLQAALEVHGEAGDKVAYLRELDPFLIDLSLRENPVGAPVGQTLADKLAILPLVREFGFQRILLGTLDYAMADELEVDDDFMCYLRDHGEDMRGCYAFTTIGRADAAGRFVPDPSMCKLRDYTVPNTLLEIYLSDRGMHGQYDLETLKRSLIASVDWLIENLPGGHPGVLINIVDGCDAFAEHPERTCRMLDLMASLPIEGVSMEDDRGTFLPFQVGAYVAMARRFLPPPLKLLVHMHAGGGFENASILEALVSGADGAWGGLPKQGALIGHASMGELVANLLRLGNRKLAERFQVDRLLPLVRRLQAVDGVTDIPENTPILGSNAYRLTLSFFAQIHGRFMDLPPELIGATTGYRICPVVSDPAVIAGRLHEVTGKPVASFAAEVLDNMVRLMRRDLREGLRIVYDEPAHLLALYERAIEMS